MSWNNTINRLYFAGSLLSAPVPLRDETDVLYCNEMYIITYMYACFVASSNEMDVFD